MPLTVPAAKVVNTGSYAGDDSANRAIPHGLGQIPSLVYIRGYAGEVTFSTAILSSTNIHGWRTAASAKKANTAMTTTDFYVGNAWDYDCLGNGAGVDYDWVAIA